ncbi:MAG TPA: hypothetical protein VFS26_01560 [Solirubrobacterales bacterium]|nr:hypothetical protein [Solirubrobacterales bacterium]
MPAIEGSQRDNTEDWVVPSGSVPTLGQLEARIDEALVIARASEAGVREVGEMALDAARRAGEAARAAEESARAAKEVAEAQVGGPAGPVAAGETPPEAPARRPEFQLRVTRFNERADRLATRLRVLQEREPATASFGRVRRRGDDS